MKAIARTEYNKIWITGVFSCKNRRNITKIYKIIFRWNYNIIVGLIISIERNITIEYK